MEKSAAPDGATFLAAGAVYQRAGRHAQACSCFRRALEGLDARGKDKGKAVAAWWRLSQSCLFLDDDAGAEDALRSAYALLQLTGDTTNAPQFFKEVHLNLSALLTRRAGRTGSGNGDGQQPQQLEEALTIIDRALDRCPHDPELGVQLGAVLRRLGRQAEALDKAWAALEYRRRGHPPEPAGAPSPPAAALPLYVLMVKVGKKYPAEHADKLARAVRRHFFVPLRILCLTDDGSGLDMEAIDEALPLPVLQGTALPGWWAKACLFAPSLPVPPGRPILYLDLDTVIVGGLSPLLDFFSPPSATSAPTLAALGTEALRSEGGRPHGLNTSVLLWRAHDPRWAPLFTDLDDWVGTVVRKLDWWVEMVAAKMEKESLLRIQDRWPGLVVDFQALDGSPGEGAAVVVFPLRPKPADVVATVPWVRENWR